MNSLERAVTNNDVTMLEMLCKNAEKYQSEDVQASQIAALVERILEKRASKQFTDEQAIKLLSIVLSYLPSSNQNFLNTLFEKANLHNNAAMLEMLCNHAKNHQIRKVRAQQTAALLSFVLEKHTSQQLTDEQAIKLLSIVLNYLPRRHQDSKVELDNIALTAEVYLHFHQYGTLNFKEEIEGFNDAILKALVTQPLSMQEANKAVNFLIKHKEDFYVALLVMLVRTDNLALAKQHLESLFPLVKKNLYQIASSVTPERMLTSSSQTQRYFQDLGLEMANSQKMLTEALGKRNKTPSENVQEKSPAVTPSGSFSDIMQTESSVDDMHVDTPSTTTTDSINISDEKDNTPHESEQYPRHSISQPIPAIATPPGRVLTITPEIKEESPEQDNIRKRAEELAKFISDNRHGDRSTSKSVRNKQEIKAKIEGLVKTLGSPTEEGRALSTLMLLDETYRVIYEHEGDAEAKRRNKEQYFIRKNDWYKLPACLFTRNVSTSKAEISGTEKIQIALLKTIYFDNLKKLKEKFKKDANSLAPFLNSKLLAFHTSYYARYATGETKTAGKARKMMNGGG